MFYQFALLFVQNKITKKKMKKNPVLIIYKNILKFYKLIATFKAKKIIENILVTIFYLPQQIYISHI